MADALAEEGDGGARGSDGDGEEEGAAVFEGEAGGEGVAYAELGCLTVGREGEAEVGVWVEWRGGGGGGVLVGGRAGWCGGEGEVVDGELLDLVEAVAGEVDGGVAGVELEGDEAGGFGVGLGGDGVGLGGAVLVDGEVEGAGVEGFEGDGDGDDVGFADGGLPLGVDVFIGGVVEGDLFDAGGAVGGEGEVVFASGDHGVVVGELPVFAWGVLEDEGGAFEGIEAPVAEDGSGDGAAVRGGGRRGRSCGFWIGRGGAVGIGGGG